ncbi:hypothetical protein DEO72_LG1g1301 [Vigna unguiculata]|uniref:Uncharacterized protein n=1 Tax=Vigna unguiculata TaxID=3917 RepID=A0A4D6KM71_VIGUN|nr:hypothetical protein DEO72_LG1g1301 [Vigna unguiculata]
MASSLSLSSSSLKFTVRRCEPQLVPPAIPTPHEVKLLSDIDDQEALRTTFQWLREGPRRKLMVDCTGEGAMFIEPDADVTLDQFGDDLHHPLPCFHRLTPIDKTKG